MEVQAALRLLGFMAENGPMVNDDGTDYLSANDWSWNKKGKHALPRDAWRCRFLHLRAKVRRVRFH